LPDFIVSLDLGQTTDYSAMVAVRRSLLLDAAGLPKRAANNGALMYRFRTVHAERFPLRTPYPKVVESVSAFVKNPRLGGRPILVVDATGVGRGIMDMFIQNPPEADLTAITIVAGHEARWEAYASQVMGAHVPKLALVSATNAMLGTKRLTIDSHLEWAKVLIQELLNFKVKRKPTGHETFEAEKSGDHDDLVMALCMAVWVGSQLRVYFRSQPDEIGQADPLSGDPDTRALVLEHRADNAREAAAIQAEADAETDRRQRDYLRSDFLWNAM
jgi:hypothetical protein